ncbi:TonB-dependent receptor [Neolewinella lacunae]|uniref:TonB-dependent receptor n=1 Tax=Neolewinella lacunae TaxID=1517758 RepID=A0A923TAF8_9BACT|nr:TonB-dependent receptor [Neolewinella lacunae]MBC6996491.1 TonB-dependent receptor [Neolewinella lacunae]MDN3636644.1 TonB-dependent receptor [Neolewinella lacunae]
MKHIFTLLLLACSGYILAQAEINGTVMDTTGTTLPGANAVLLRSSDSLLTAFATTDNNGVFRMENVPVGDYLLRVTFLGYERPDQQLKVTTDDQYFGLGDIKLYPAGFFLNGVEVTADRIPIRMKGDTMMYDADAFAVGENAVVEDLLRRLPGMAVDASGQITWRGKPISEVMINGKPFFAGNSTLLTQNLDAKAIKNVEVYDQKSDAEEVSGLDDGTENMTVNLDMKEDFKAKVFGEIYGGYGTEERYQAGGKTFRISDATQIGVLGTVNNVNKVGFSGDEIAGFNGSSGRGQMIRFGGDGPEGLPFDSGNATGQNRSIAAGVNFGRSIGKDGQLTMDYALFDRNQAQQSTSLQAFNRANDRRITETMEGSSADSYSHRLGFEFRQKLDSFARIRVEGALNLSGGDNLSAANTIIRNDETLVDDYSVRDFSEVDQPRGNLSLDYNRRIGRDEGRTFRAGINGSYQKNQNDIDVLTDGLNEGLAIPGALVNGQQIQNRLTNSTNLGASVNFTNPLSDKWRISARGEASYDKDEGDYRFRVGEESTINLLDRTWTVYTAGTGLIYEFGKGGNLSFGADYAAPTLDLAGDQVQSTNYGFLLPYTRLRLRMKKGFFSANINSDARAPAISQLQTIAQPGTSGRVTVGNPNLTPAVNTRFNSFIWFNDQFRAISANANVSATYTDNAFGNAVTFTDGQQIYQTINVGHAWSGNIYLGTTIGMNFINGELRIDGGLNGSRGEGFVDGVSRVNTTVSSNAGANVTTELNEDSFIKVGYSFNRFSNSFQGDESPTTTQLTHNLLGQFELEVSPKWRFESRFMYSIFAASQFAAQQNIPDLRLSLELRPFRKKGHFLRISASDLFNQNTIVNRSVNPFVTTETTADGLGRYFLATFHYKL